MTTDKRNNQGEGDREADRKFRREETQFVRSEEGKRKIAEAGKLGDEEARKLREVEEKTKARARAEDPAVSSGSGGSRSPAGQPKH